MNEPPCLCAILKYVELEERSTRRRLHPCTENCYSKTLASCLSATNKEKESQREKKRERESLVLSEVERERVLGILGGRQRLHWTGFCVLGNSLFVEEKKKRLKNRVRMKSL